MKKATYFLLATAITALLLPLFVSAQDEKSLSAVSSLYLISAKAGGVNLVEGNVNLVRQRGTSGRLLKTDSVEIGDVVATGEDGKAEILLNPGSFVRLGPNTKFEFVTTDLDDLKLKLTSGSAILEVFADSDFKVTVATPKSELVIAKTGVYRLDIANDGQAFVSVWKGRLTLAGGVELKEGRTARVGSTDPNVAKFDRDNKDDLTVWSQLRAKEAVKLNSKLQGRTLRTALIGSFDIGQWDMFSTFGVWAWNARSGRWCFVPFGWGWYSPYGFGYNMDFWGLRLPPYVYYPPVRTVIGPPPVTPTGGNGPRTGGSVKTISDRRIETQNGSGVAPSVRPGFQRFEINQGIGTRGGRLDPGRLDGPVNDGGIIRGGGGGGAETRGPASFPSSQPSGPVNNTPPIIAPPTSGGGDSKGKDNQ